MNNPIVNLGDLTKPAVALIEKLAEGAGVFYAPRHIREVAKAEADASIIRAAGEVQAQLIRNHQAFLAPGLGGPILRRMVAEETRKQGNLEAIIDQTIPQLEANAKPEVISNDWLNHFLDKARLFSDEEMQLLWSRILAGESNSPGSFSRRTINRLAEIEKNEAICFTEFCGSIFSVGEFRSPVIFDYYDPLYSENGITYSNLMDLESIGLVKMFQADSDSGLHGFSMPIELIPVTYFDTTIQIYSRSEDDFLPVGHVLLTEVGRQISEICRPRPIVGMMDAAIVWWSKQGWDLDPLSCLP